MSFAGDLLKDTILSNPEELSVDGALSPPAEILLNGLEAGDYFPLYLVSLHLDNPLIPELLEERFNELSKVHLTDKARAAGFRAATVNDFWEGESYYCDGSGGECRKPLLPGEPRAVLKLRDDTRDLCPECAAKYGGEELERSMPVNASVSCDFSAVPAAPAFMSN